MVTYRSALGPRFDAAPDDTEETLVGSSAHQDAIGALATGLRLNARRRNLPWHVGNQLTIVAPRLAGGAPWQPAPDILVHPTLGSSQQQSLRVGDVGPPTLIIEVTSPSTARERDLSDDLGRGKPALYAEIGVAEYLVFDPFGEFLPDRVRGYRAADTPHGRQFVPWEPEEDGRWYSALGVSFAPQGFLLRVYDADGALLPISEELDDRNANLTDENRYLTAENVQLADDNQLLVTENQRLAAQALDDARRLAALEAELRRLREREDS